MIKHRIGFNVSLLIILLSYSVACNPHQPKGIDNYVSVGDPVRVQISIYNGSKILVFERFSLLYTLDQPEIGKTLHVPVHHDMDNLTIIATLWSEQSPSPLSQTVKNLTRYARIRAGNDFSFSMELEGVPEDKQKNSSYGLHIPVRYSILLLYIDEPVPYDRHYLNFFNFKVATKQNRKFFVPSIDLSQLQVPFKTYKHINSIQNDTHDVLFSVKVYSFRYYQFFFGFTNKQLLQQANPLLAQIYTDDMIDVIKETIFDNNFYLVVIYFALSFIQIFMQIFAFKSEIEIWRKIQTRPGLSIQILYQRLVFQVIICLYLIQKNSNKLYLGFQLFDLALTCWKITKAIKISFSRQNRFFISIRYKQWYNSKIQSADSTAMHYTNYLILFFFVPFMIYKTYPLANQAYNHYIKTQQLLIPSLRKVYSFVLESSVFFILIFGFVMMTPQLYINYKLKSVDHLPWKTLIYRFIYTIIDDIFVFMIDLPWLQRMFSFRDDIIFVLYLIQRRIYRVDKNRLALSTGSIDLSTVVKKQPTQHIKAQ